MKNLTRVETIKFAFGFRGFALFGFSFGGILTFLFESFALVFFFFENFVSSSLLEFRSLFLLLSYPLLELSLSISPLLSIFPL